jgi:hypothetical protein
MSLYDGDPVEIEIIDTDNSSQPVESVEDLMSSYNDTKRNASNAAASLSSGLTLRGMDSINERVAKGVKQINAFVNNGKKQTTAAKVASKTVAVFDPKNRWVGKWLNNAKDEVATEELLEKSINEIISEVVADIEAKKEEVIKFIESALKVRVEMQNSISTYERILEQAELTLPTYEEYSRESYNTKSLVINVTATIENLKDDITNVVNVLIGSANITVGEISKKLPTIENELMYKGEFKAFQQSISDLNDIMNAAVDMASDTGDIVRKDINETVYSTLESLGNNGLDIKRVKKIRLEEATHRANIEKLMRKTKTQMDNDYDSMKQLKLELDQNRETNSTLLIENYAK